MAFTYGRYGDCHFLMHAWETVPSDWTPSHGGVPVTVRCMRCGMERRDTVGTNTGEVVARRYVAPEGYYWQRATDDDIRPTRNDYRLAWVTKHVLEAGKKRRARKAVAA